MYNVHASTFVTSSVYDYAALIILLGKLAEVIFI
jgi:hypothetical protein